MQALAVAQHDLAGAGETENALGVKLRQRARHGLERQAEIVADAAAAHRQRHHAGNGETTIHFEQEGRNPLHRGLAAGIAEWRAGVTPADKIARIGELKRRGAKVLMVGDGMNDALSLAAADVSMSPISAAHLSRATADLVFLGRPLVPVVAAIQDMAKFHGNDGWMLPIPAVFVVGRDGIVKARFVDPDFRKRMEIDDLLAALESASRER